MYVVQSKYMDVAKMLLLADADPNIHDSVIDLVSLGYYDLIRLFFNVCAS